KKSLALVFSFLLLFYSCGERKKVTSLLNGDVISIRSQTKKAHIRLFKLKAPALLTGATKVDGKIQVNPALKERILKEQKDFLEEVKKISPEVKVIYKYRMVLNAVALLVEPGVVDKIKKLPHLSFSEKEGRFARAKTQFSLEEKEENKFLNLKEKNSVRFIGANKVHEKLSITLQNGKKVSVEGQGMRVGILDSGIDYTHSMLGGKGTIEAYKSVDPEKESDQFPNKKVVGGLDLVGADYNVSSPVAENRVPRPDPNPIDESGHGTHVAGTVAGIGDGQKTYSGVAPKADLYAIKVFGKNGSTGDTVIIAGLEYAADPNKDLDPNDQLHVVNLSLGGGYGEPHNLYREAIRNLVKGGTVVVASAGNAGHSPYIVGSPSTSDEAISVAASVDDMTHNIEFEASSISGPDGFSLLVETIQGNISRAIKEEDRDSIELVYIEENKEAARDYSDEEKDLIQGKVVLIDRGKVSFLDKLKRAHEAGAKGALVVNNKPGSPIMMGGEGKVDLPAIMISLTKGDIVKEKMKGGSVALQFRADEKIVKSNLIDTLTGFSSRGPRSIDSLLKPEITAPGEAIVSAFVGKGDKGVAFSGTSMSAPHIAGVMALLKQYRKDLSPKELKSVLMNTAKTLSNDKGETYPVSMQGAGRVQTLKAATSRLVVLPYGISLGNILVESKKMTLKTLQIKNISDQQLTLTPSYKVSETLEVVLPSEISLAAGETKQVEVRFIYNAPKGKLNYEELSGFIFFLDKETKKEFARVPLIGISQRVSRIKVEKALIHSSSEDDSQEAIVDLGLKNKGKNAGEALIFNLLGEDERKPIKDLADITKSDICDLEAAGYRLVKRKEVVFLQLAMKLYKPMTTWHHCELNLQIDSDGDNKADQELVGTRNVYVPGLSKLPGNFYSILLDAKKARELRKEFEKDVAEGKKGASQNYQGALLGISGMKYYDQSTVGIIEVDLSLINRNKEGKIALKASVLHEAGNTVQMDDYLKNHAEKWYEIDPSFEAMSYRGMPEVVTVPAEESVELTLVRGEGAEKLMTLFPQNRSSQSQVVKDEQLSTPSVEYAY
ncbi:MAG: S8 family serine peptidase, partial [Bdellovibrionota bacterium]|nr:S8 family serine peptidase [Bdellovibrionota bacterium]